MADTDPRSWRLLLAMQVALQRISRANGYYTDAGLHVTLEPRQLLADDEAVALALAMGAAQRSDDQSAVRGSKVVNIVVFAKVAADADGSQLLLHQLLDDIDRAFEDHAVKMPEQTSYPQFSQFIPIPAADGLNWVGAEVHFTSSYLRRPRRP